MAPTDRSRTPSDGGDTTKLAVAGDVGAPPLTSGSARRLQFPAHRDIFLGRDRDCDIRFHDLNPGDLTLISRVHAILRFDRDQWVVVDKSQNGVYVSGSRAPRCHPRPAEHHAGQPARATVDLPGRQSAGVFGSAQSADPRPDPRGTWAPARRRQPEDYRAPTGDSAAGSSNQNAAPTRPVLPRMEASGLVTVGRPRRTPSSWKTRWPRACTPCWLILGPSGNPRQQRSNGTSSTEP